MKSQLLCTFCNTGAVDTIVAEIHSRFTIVANTIYLLDNLDDPDQVCCTYNVVGNHVSDLPYGTIALHRKKHTNTLYTINALNELIRELNDGMLDRTFPIKWEDYKNMILITTHGKLKKIPTALRDILNMDE